MAKSPNNIGSNTPKPVDASNAKAAGETLDAQTSSPTQDYGDLTEDRIVKLGDFLRKSTEGRYDISHKNFIPIDPGEYTQGSGSRLNDKNTGRPAALMDPKDPSDSLQQTYMQQMRKISETAINEFANIGSPGAVDSRGGGSGLVDVYTKADKNSQQTGHHLLNNLGAGDEATVVRPVKPQYDIRLSSVLRKNRFTNQKFTEQLANREESPLQSDLLNDWASSRVECPEAFIGASQVPRSDVDQLNNDTPNLLKLRDDGLSVNSIPTADQIEAIGNIGRSLMLIASGDAKMVAGEAYPQKPLHVEDGKDHAKNNAAVQGDLLAAAISSIADGRAGLKFGEGTVPTGTDKIPVSELRSGYAWGPMHGQELVDLHGIPSSDKEAHSSYGQMNNYLEPFAKGFSPQMYTLAINNFTMIFAASVAWAAIIDITVIAAVTLGPGLANMGTIQANTDAATAGPAGIANNKNRPNTMALGRRRGYPRPATATQTADGSAKDPAGILLEVANIDILGMLLDFFGVNIPFNYMSNMKNFIALPYTRACGTGFLQFFVNLALDPRSSGFFANLTRQALRDAADVNMRPNPSNSEGFMAALGALENLRDSATIKFINRMADLGEIASISGFFGNWGYSPSEGPLEGLPDGPNWTVAKVRKGSGTQTTATSNLPGLYLLPASLVRADIQAGLIGEKTDFASYGSTFMKNEDISEFHRSFLNDVKKANWDSAVVNKIGNRDLEGNLLTSQKFTPEDVKLVESMLESEYMPFYFQDLRTNEIVAFHAFLTSLSDAYAPTFSALGGFGRIDPARVYEKTERTIAVNFVVYAANESDFDEMWHKINKMVTLVYPQWSAGTMLETDKNERFTQPFSQIPTATPLIRLRVGDLLKSNLSRQNFNRLQGLGNPQLGDSDFRKKVDDIFNEEVKGGNLQAYLSQIGKKPEMKGTGTKIYNNTGRGYPIGSKLYVDLKAGTIVTAGKSQPLLSNQVIYAKEGGKNHTVKVGVDKTDVVCEVVGFRRKRNMSDKDTGQAIADHVIVKIPDDAIAAKKIAHLKEAGPLNDPLVELEWYDREPAGARTGDFIRYNAELMQISGLGGPSSVELPAETVDPPKGLAALMGSNNPMYRAFEQGMGRGLAGVITSLTFDWKIAEGLWETSPGSRGPMQCEVQLNFAPIHDIAPGIDHEGFNRAPIYGIGKSSGQLQGDPWMSNADKIAEDKERQAVLPTRVYNKPDE